MFCVCVGMFHPLCLHVFPMYGLFSLKKETEHNGEWYMHSSCMARVQYVQILIPLWVVGDAFIVQHVSLSADQGILSQLEWSICRGKGFLV